MAFSPTVVPPLRAPSATVSSSTFVHGGPLPERQTPKTRDTLRVRMGAAAAAFHPSSSAAAAAALRAAGGVDPHTHHVASVLRHASAAGTRLEPPASRNPSESPQVTHATAVGGGVVGGDAAVAADAAAKSQAWAETLKALRAAGMTDLESSLDTSVSSKAVSRSSTAAAPASAVSRPVSVTVVGAPRVAKSSYASRMARLSEYAAAKSASMAAEAAAVEADAPVRKPRPSVEASLLAAVSGAVLPWTAREVAPAPEASRNLPPPAVNEVDTTPPSAAKDRPVDREPEKSSSTSPVTLASPIPSRTSVGAWNYAPVSMPSLSLATSATGGTAPSTPLPTPLPSTMTSFMASKPLEEPMQGEDDDEAEAAASDAMRAVLPPMLTAAFVGACLALSHVGAVLGSGMTPM
ncbi:hypothetical protein MMPV_004397 [Pyropia vietnamensis]